MQRYVAIRDWFDRNFTLKGLVALVVLIFCGVPDWKSRGEYWEQVLHWETIKMFALSGWGRLMLIASGGFIIWLDHRGVLKNRKSERQLNIKSARYGVGSDRYTDVTAQVKAQVKNNKLNFLVSNVTLLGLADPFYGEVKYLTVEYSFGNGPVREIIRREQDQLEITEEGDNPLQQAESSLQQRAFDTARIVRTQWLDFNKKIGAKPDYAGPTLGQGQAEASAEYLKQSMAWQDRARGWYEGKAREGLVQIRSELAEHGLIDQDLDDNIGLRSPTEESIQIICQRLKWLACQLDD